MGIIKKRLGINVLEAANERVRQLFETGCKIYLDTSGGKDSIVLQSIVYNLCKSGEINSKQLEVSFIDEEVIYGDVIRICQEWRKRFMLIGVPYHWYTIEHRNNNCFNALENNESFIPWDRYEEANWAHEKPKYAESESPYLVPRTENYQDFLHRAHADGITIIGVRCAESIQRLQNVADINKCGGISKKRISYPICDWSDADIWKYIKDNNLNFPETYLRMWESGVPRKNLRICNLFAIDTCRSLVSMFEVYPDLWERVLRREPNAYLVRLYWDTEMFHRNTKNRKKLEGDEGESKNYRQMFIDVITHPHKYFKNKHALSLCEQYRRSIYIALGSIMTEEDFRRAYEGIMGGDTKSRTLRALRSKIYGGYLKRSGFKEGGTPRK